MEAGNGMRCSEACGTVCWLGLVDETGMCCLLAGDQRVLSNVKCMTLLRGTIYRTHATAVEPRQLHSQEHGLQPSPSCHLTAALLADAYLKCNCTLNNHAIANALPKYNQNALKHERRRGTPDECTPNGGSCAKWSRKGKHPVLQARIQP